MIQVREKYSNCLYGHVAINEILFPINVVNVSLSTMNLASLAALGQTSKTWTVLTDNAPIWINVCQEAGIFPQCKPAFFAAIKQDNIDAWGSFIELLSNTYNIGFTEAEVRIALWRLENKAAFLTDQKAITLLQKVVDNKTVSETLRLGSSYFKALFICEDRDSKLGYPAAHKIFKNIQKNKNVPQDLSLQAMYQIALMKAKGQIQTNDYSQVADSLLKLINDQNASAKMRFNANFYLAELVLTNCSTKVTKIEAVKLLKDAVANKDLPKSMRKHGSFLLDSSKNISKESYSESEIAFESTSSTDFARTALMKNKIKKQPNYSKSSNTLNINGKDFHVINSKTIDFNQPVASCGSSSSREIILLDPKNSPLLNEHFQCVVRKLNPIVNITEDQVFSIVSTYVRFKIFNPHMNTKKLLELEHFVLQKQIDKTKSPVIAIDDFIAIGLGVCRHHALVTAYILYRLTEWREFGLSGIVQVIRDNLKSGGAHAWVTYATKNRMVHIDTLWNCVVDFTEHTGKMKLESVYGSQVILNQIRKVERALSK